jgi:tetratricopeptide (TPR) repeat protein
VVAAETVVDSSRTLSIEEIMRALALIALLAAPVAAHAQAPAKASVPATEGAAGNEELARQHFQLGRAQYESGQFRDAAASFERAHELSQREMLWYNIYLAYRDVGDNAKAATALRNYLTRVEQVENRAQLEARLANLDRLVQQEQERAKQEQANEQAAADQQVQTEAEASDSRAAVDAASADPSEPAASPSIVPYVLMGVGGAMMVGGVVTGLMASSKHGELEEQCPDSPCDPSLQDLADEGQTLALTADILLFGGLAVAATGGVLWFLDRGSARSDEPVAASMSCGLRGCGARVRMSF